LSTDNPKESTAKIDDNFRAFLERQKTERMKQAADKVWEFVKDDPNVTGVGINKEGVRVNLEYSDEGGLETLTEIEGVPVTYVVTGRIQRQTFWKQVWDHVFRR
jgi:hypothetical protein